MDICFQDLNRAERTRIESFQSPEDLLDDLKKRAENKKSRSLYGWTEVEHSLKTVKRVLEYLLFAMRPYNIKTGLFWGLLYLTIDVSFSTCCPPLTDSSAFCER